MATIHLRGGQNNGQASKYQSGQQSVQSSEQRIISKMINDTICSRATHESLSFAYRVRPT